MKVSPYEIAHEIYVEKCRNHFKYYFRKYKLGLILSGLWILDFEFGTNSQS